MERLKDSEYGYLGSLLTLRDINWGLELPTIKGGRPPFKAKPSGSLSSPSQPGLLTRSSRAPPAHLPRSPAPPVPAWHTSTRICPPSLPPACRPGRVAQWSVQPSRSSLGRPELRPRVRRARTAPGKCAPWLPVSAIPHWREAGRGAPALESRPLALPGTCHAEPEVGAARGGSSLQGSGMREANPATARVG